LLAVVKSEAPLAQRSVAFQAYVQLLRDTPQLKGRIQSVTAALEIAPRVEDKKMVLAALGDLPGPDSLKLAEACLRDPGLVEEAAMAVVTIANAKGLNKAAYPAATAALTKVLQASQNQRTRQQAQETLTRLESPK
jgi:HEAT repeat protein